MRKKDINTFAGLFIIIVGVLPFLGVYTGDFAGKIINILLIACGVLLILRR